MDREQHHIHIYHTYLVYSIYIHTIYIIFIYFSMHLALHISNKSLCHIHTQMTCAMHCAIAFLHIHGPILQGANYMYMICHCLYFDAISIDSLIYKHIIWLRKSRHRSLFKNHKKQGHKPNKIPLELFLKCHKVSYLLLI